MYQHRLSRAKTKTISLIVLCLCALALGGYWIGEHLDFLAAIQYGTLLFVLLTFFACWLVRQGGFLLMMCVGLCSTTTIVYSWHAGQQTAVFAFNECVSNGERVRQQLAEHHQKYGNFPTHLRALKSNLPCQLALPPQLLQYSQTTTGYFLWFGDWLVTHHATESEPLMAHK